MNNERFAKRVVIGAGLLVLYGLPAVSLAQGAAPAAAPSPQHAPPPALRPQKALGPMDDLAGLQYTDEQKVKIRAIHEDIKSRRDAVIKSDKLSPEQKGAMLQGYAHMERDQVYKLLTPDQQVEVRKKALARRAEAQKANEGKQPLQLSPAAPQSQFPQSPPPS